MSRKSQCGRVALLFSFCVAFGSFFGGVRDFGWISSVGASPTLGSWSSVVDWPILPIHLIVTKDGKVLSFGADAPPSSTTGLGFKKYDIWDPETDLHTTVFQNSHDYFCSTALNLPESGGVLIAGGDDFVTNSTGVTLSSVFSPELATVSSIPDMEFPRWYPTGITLPNGEVLVQGGYKTSSTFATTPEIYNEETGWRSLNGATSSIVYGESDGEDRWWYPRTWTYPDGKVFGIAQSMMYTLDPSGSGSVTTHGRLPVGYRGGGTSTSVMYEPGKILQVGGGAQGNLGGSTAYDTALVIDINSGSPVVTTLSSTMAFKRHWANATVLPNGQVLVNGGSAENNQLTGVAYSSEIWDPNTDTWTTVAAETQARLYHSSTVLLADGRVLSAGGGSPGPVANLDAQFFSPPYLYNPDGSLATRPELLWAPKDLAYGVNFSALIGSSDTAARVTLVKTSAVTHSFNSDQRFMELSFTQSGDELTITPPADPNLMTPGYYLLSVINSSGVVSESKIVSLLNSTQAGDVQLLPGDVTPPIISITSPGNGSIQPGPPVSMSGALSDGGSVLSVQTLIQDRTEGSPITYWNGSQWVANQSWTNATFDSGSWSDSIDFPSGDFRIQAYAIDNAGNEAFSPNRFITVGKVFMNAPVPLAKLSGASQQFSWNPGSGINIVNYELEVGASKGSNSYYDSGSIGASQSHTASGLPTDGSEIWVRLKYTPSGESEDYIDTRYTAAGDPVKINFPSPGSELPGSTVNFQWSAPGTTVAEYWLYVGSSQGGSDYYDSNPIGTDVSHVVSGLPTSGETVWVRLWYSPNGDGYTFIDRSFTAASGGGGGGIEITSPLPGTELSGTTQLFEWTSGSNSYWVYAGPSQGSASYYNSGNLSAATQVTVTGLPNTGGNVWVRLWYLEAGVWEYVDELYTAATGGGGGGGNTAMDSPDPGTELDGSSVTFSWSGNGIEYWIYAGSSQGGTEYFNSGNLQSATSTLVTGLPTNGQNIWIRLWYLVNGNWEFIDEQYTGAAGGGSADTSIDLPNPGSELSGELVNFSWSGNGSEYWLYAGSTQGGSNYFDSGNLFSATTVLATGLPTNGQTVWIRLWYLVGGSWAFVDEQYTAASTGGGGTAISSPPAGGTLSSSNETFSWSGNGEEYWLYAGPTIGSGSYYDSGNLFGATTHEMTGLPTGSVTIWVRLWYLVDGNWLFIDESYTSAP